MPFKAKDFRRPAQYGRLTVFVVLGLCLALSREAMGSEKALSEAIKAHPEWNIHALLVSKRSQLVYEGYFSGKDQRWGEDLGTVTFTRDTIHDLRSISKSIIGTLIGIALEDKVLKGLDQKAINFFPEYQSNKAWKEVTLRHLLTMSLGLAWKEDVPYDDPRNDEANFIRSGGDLTYVFKKPFTSKPGQGFLYNGGATEILTAILERASGKSAKVYLEEKLLKPLQIDSDSYEWLAQKNGRVSGASGLRMKPLALHKIALLFLAKGRHDGRQIVSPGWLAKATRAQVKLSAEEGFGLFGGYGYQWWIPRLVEHKGGQSKKSLDAFAGLGNGGQILLIVPEQDLVFQMHAGRYNDFSPVLGRILNTVILPKLDVDLRLDVAVSPAPP